MIDIRNERGEFVGVFDGTVERRGFDLRLPVLHETAYFADRPVSRVTAQVVRLEWAQWSDRDGINWILKAMPSAETLLPRASHVFVRGQTSPTWLDHELNYRESLQRLVWLMILHKLPTTGTRH